MTSKQILKELEKYLQPIMIMRLKSNIKVMPASIVICMTVADIIKDPYGRDEDEEIACTLLSKLLKIHFNKRNKINQPQP